MCACLNVCSQRGGQCISCSYKANHGMLFLLEKGFIFVHKPALHVCFDEVENNVAAGSQVPGGGGADNVISNYVSKKRSRSTESLT